MNLFLVLIIPATNDVMIPAVKLMYVSDPTENPMIPPIPVDTVPMYGPNRIPMIGAIIAAAVIAAPGIPIIGEILMKPRIAYNEAKIAANAASLLVSLKL